MTRPGVLTGFGSCEPTVVSRAETQFDARVRTMKDPINRADGLRDGRNPGAISIAGTSGPAK